MDTFRTGRFARLGGDAFEPAYPAAVMHVRVYVPQVGFRADDGLYRSWAGWRQVDGRRALRVRSLS